MNGKGPVRKRHKSSDGDASDDDDTARDMVPVMAISVNTGMRRRSDKTKYALHNPRYGKRTASYDSLKTKTVGGAQPASFRCVSRPSCMG